MSAVFFEEMQIPKPDYLLDIHGLTHGAMTGQMLEKKEKVLVDEKPDIALIYVDGRAGEKIVNFLVQGGLFESQ